MKIALIIATWIGIGALAVGCAAQTGPEEDERLLVSAPQGSASAGIAPAYDVHDCWRDCMEGQPDNMGMFCSCACGGVRCTKALP
jgi:hypothetical protein